MAKQFVREIEESVVLYRDDKNGIAWIENGKAGVGHSVHSNIDASGSVTGMKNLGYWDKKARTVRSHGFIYNIDTFICSDKYDEIVADECMCVACNERRKRSEADT